MWPMNKLLQTGELVAALAVVVSVVILTVEIRQNSEAQVRSATQVAVSDYIQSLERLVDNPDFVCLYIRGAQDYFSPHGPGHWLCDLGGLAERVLNQRGVNQVFRDPHCSYRDADLFYSYRRDTATGRMAALIWID